MPGKLSIDIQVLPEGVGLPVPSYMSDGAAGCDLFAAIDSEICIAPGARSLIPAGFAIELPFGFEAQIRPRSGLALHSGVTCLNSPGTIDSDYRGPVCVILVNHGREPFTVKRGDRIAQMVISRVESALFNVVERLDATSRATGGFGSTGDRETA